jgi:hypothetical protein
MSSSSGASSALVAMKAFLDSLHPLASSTFGVSGACVAISSKTSSGNSDSRGRELLLTSSFDAILSALLATDTNSNDDSSRHADSSRSFTLSREERAVYTLLFSASSFSRARVYGSARLLLYTTTALNHLLNICQIDGYKGGGGRNNNISSSGGSLCVQYSRCFREILIHIVPKLGDRLEANPSCRCYDCSSESISVKRSVKTSLPFFRSFSLRTLLNLIMILTCCGR